jgi:hypothetical protein
MRITEARQQCAYDQGSALAYIMRQITPASLLDPEKCSLRPPSTVLRRRCFMLSSVLPVWWPCRTPATEKRGTLAGFHLQCAGADVGCTFGWYAFDDILPPHTTSPITMCESGSSGRTEQSEMRSRVCVCLTVALAQASPKVYKDQQETRRLAEDETQG